MVDISSLRLEADQLRRTCDLDKFSFKTTEELTVEQTIIGQSRGVQAIEFGIDIEAPGFNIFALGPTGTGRATAIQRFLEKHAQQGQVPLDWVYVNNFELEHQPRAIEFPSGQGGQFCKDMESLIQRLRDDVPLALEAEAFLDAVSALRQEYDEKRDSTLKGVLAEAQQANFTIVRSPTGLLVAPLDENMQIIPPGEIEKMDRELYAKLEKVHEQLQERLSEALREVRDLDRIQREEEQHLMREAAAFAVDQHVGDMREHYVDHDEVLLYLSQVREDVLDNLDDFRVEDAEVESLFFLQNERADLLILSDVTK
jgi:hypothetical protein